MSSSVPTFADPAALRDWHETFRAVRQHDGVHWDEGLGAWLVTRYADVSAGLRDQRLGSSGPTSFMELMDAEDRVRFAGLREFYESWMVFSDPPYHDQVRQCVQTALTPRVVGAWRQMVRQRVSDHLDVVANGGDVEIMAQLARPVAIETICGVLDVPVADWELFSSWSQHIIGFIAGTRPEPASAELAEASCREMGAYVREFAVRLERDGPVQHPIRAVAPLGEGAMVGTFAQFLTGGIDPVSAALGNGIAILLDHPDQFERLRNDRSLIPLAVEELLRYEPPFTMAPRVAREDFSWGEHRLAAGSRVLLMLTAANRDDAAFERPDDLDLGRSPNHHLSFGKGGHYCIGAALARLVLTECLDVLLERVPHLELTGAVEWTATLGLRSVTCLPVTASSGRGHV